MYNHTASNPQTNNRIAKTPRRNQYLIEFISMWFGGLAGAPTFAPWVAMLTDSDGAIWLKGSGGW
jgi:hypothetical protein